MLGKMGDMMAKLQEAKKIADEVKTKLDNTILVSESFGGEIKIEITGNKLIKNILIDSQLQQGDKTILEKKLTQVVNEAIAKAEKINAEEMKKVAGGLMPGLF